MFASWARPGRSAGRRWAGAARAVAVMSLVAACAPSSDSRRAHGPGWVDLERVQHARDAEWPLNGRTFGGEHFSPLAMIDAGNVGRLGFAWEFKDFVVRGRTHRALEANPVMIDGRLYFPGPWGVVYALDARTGKTLWTYDPQADGQAGRQSCCDVVNRGIVVWKGKVYVGSTDGWLVAIDAGTGKPVWKTDTIVDRHFTYTITGAPMVAGGNILIGNAGADMGARGYVSAYSLATGKLAWRFWAVPGDPAKGPDETPDVALARKTWSKDTRWQFGGGGNDWDAIAFDPKLSLAYFGFGNGSPHPSQLRNPGGGDDLYTDSIVAVDVNTGRMKWHYQETPGDSWDYDACSPMVLADLNIGGRARQVLMQAPKNGFFYVLDRRTGELLKADAYTKVTWADEVDLKTGRPHVIDAGYVGAPKTTSPSAAGGHAWQPMAWNAKAGLVYLPVYEAAMNNVADPLDRFVPGTINQQHDGSFSANGSDDGSAKGPLISRLTAWDPVAGKAVWRSGPLPFISGGVLATAGGLVFEGSTDGILTVYEAHSGKVLKRIGAGTAIMAAPMTYAIDGVQYVAVLGGFGGPQGGFYAPGLAPAKYQNNERLMVFRLDGGPTPLPPMAVHAERQPTPQPIPASPATLARGAGLYKELCARCHVTGGAFGEYPDLWNMPSGTLTAFRQIVHGGAFRYAGMGDFSDVLSPSDVDAIKAFIVHDEINKRRSGQAAGAHFQVQTH